MTTQSTFTDEDLTHLLTVAAVSFDVPDQAPVARAVHAAVPPRRSWRERVGPNLVGIAAAVSLLGLAGGAIVASGGSGGSDDESASLSPAMADAQGGSGSTVDSGSTSGGSVGVPEAPTTRGGFTGVVGDQSGGRSGGSTGSSDGTTAPAPSQGRVVKTGDIALVVADGKVSTVLDEVQRLATAQGGIVFGSSTQETGPTPTGRVTVRVPVDRFEAVVLAVRGLDAEVRVAQTRASDVTAQYTDLQAQVRSLRATRDRYLVLLERADTLGQVLSVQQRVDAVSLQVDQVEGRLRVLGSQSAMSTLAVSVSEQGDPTAAPEQDEDGLGGAWDDAVDGFTGGIEALVRRSGTALVVGLCLVALWLVGSLGYRVARRRAL